MKIIHSQDMSCGKVYLFEDSSSQYTVIQWDKGHRSGNVDLGRLLEILSPDNYQEVVTVSVEWLVSGKYHEYFEDYLKPTTEEWVAFCLEHDIDY